MNPAIPLVITRYGLSKAKGGWDSPGDSGTDQFRGDGIPDGGYAVLNRSACALTASAEDALARTLLAPGVIGSKEPMRLPIGTLLYVSFDDVKFNQVRVLLDRAPEPNGRCDLFLPYHDDPLIPDNGLVSVLLLPS